MEEVGRVSIRVVPDFRHFRKHLNRVLKQYDNRTLNWKVDVDDKGLKALSTTAKEVGNRAGKSIVDELGKAGKQASKKLNKELELDPEALTGNRDRLVRRLRSDLERVLSKMEFNIGLAGYDDATARMALDRQEKRLKKMFSEITPELDTTDFLQKARQLEAELDFLSERAVQLDPRKRYEQRLGEWLAAEKRFTALQQKEAGRRFDLMMNKAQEIKDYFSKITPTAEKIDSRTLISQYKQQLAGLKDELKLRVPVSFDEKNDIDKLYTRIQLLEKSLELEIPVDFNIKQTAMAKLAAEMALIEGMMGGITDRVQKESSGLRGALPKFGTGLNPAAYGVIILGIAAVAAPLIGLVTAALLTLPGLISLVATPIASVMLGLDGIKRAAESIKEPFDKMREVISTKLEEKFTPIFDKLVGLFPLIQTGAIAVNDGIAKVADTVTDFLVSADTKTKLEQTFTGIANAVANSAPGVRDFTAAIVDLAHQFVTGGALEGVGRWFNETMADFRQWVASTDLNKSFSALGDTLKVILDTAGALAKGGLDFISNPEKMDGFVATLRDLGDMLQRVVDVSNKLAPVWDAINWSLGGDSYKQMVDNFKKDTDRFEGVSDTIGGFDMDLAIDAERKWYEKLGGASIGIGRTKEELIAAVQENQRLAAEGGGKVAESYQNGIAQALAGNKDAQREFLKGALTGEGISENVAAAIKEQATIAITGAQQALVPLKEGLQTDIDDALKPLGDISGKVVKAFADVPTQLSGALATVPSVITGAFALITIGLGTQAEKVSTAFTNGFANLPQKIGQSFAGVPAAVGNALNGPIATAVSNSMNSAVQAMNVGGAQVAAAAATSFVGVVTAIAGQMQIAVTTVATFCGMMATTALSYTGAMKSSGLALGAAFAEGLASAGDLVSAAANSLMGLARAFFPNSPAKTGPFSGSGWIDKSGEAIGKGFASGIDGASNSVVASAKELMQAIKDVFGSAEGININFFMGQAASNMSAMATSSKEFRSNMVEAGTTPALNPETTSASGEAQMSLDEIKRLKAENALKIAELRQQIGLTEDKAAKKALDNEIKALDVQQKRLDLMKQEAPMQEERKTAIQQLSDTIATNIQDMIKMPGDFANATIGAAASDLGISGSGALPTIANWAMDAGTNFIFNVSNMDDALQGQQAQQNRQKLGITG